MTIRDMFNEEIQFCNGDMAIFRIFDEKKDEIINIAYTNCLGEGLESLHNGEAIMDARIKAIYLEDGHLVFFIDDPEKEQCL